MWSLFSSRNQLTFPCTAFGPRVSSAYVLCLMFCHIDHRQRLKDCSQLLHPLTHPPLQKQYHHFLINPQRTRNLMKFNLKKMDCLNSATTRLYRSWNTNGQLLTHAHSASSTAKVRTGSVTFYLGYGLNFGLILNIFLFDAHWFLH